jgi:hypothetical protein
MRCFGLTVARQQQQRAGQPFLTGVEELVDEILLDADIPRQHVREEAIRERGTSVEFAHLQSTRSAGVSAVALFDLLIAVAAPWRACTSHSSSWRRTRLHQIDMSVRCWQMTPASPLRDLHMPLHLPESSGDLFPIGDAIIVPANES